MAQNKTSSSDPKTSDESSDPRLPTGPEATEEQSITDSTPLSYEENIPLKKRVQDKKLLDRLFIKEGGFIDKKIRFGDNYDFISVLGKGAFGHVLRARQKDHECEEVALKVIAKNELKQSELNAIRNEVEIHSNMDHPNIVRLRRIHETKETLVIEMDLCRFGNLN